jgi:hypothetical protein
LGSFFKKWHGFAKLKQYSIKDVVSSKMTFLINLDEFQDDFIKCENAFYDCNTAVIYATPGYTPKLLVLSFDIIKPFEVKYNNLHSPYHGNLKFN